MLKYYLIICPTIPVKPVGMGMVLDGYSNAEPVPIPVHICDWKHMVLPIPVSHFNSVELLLSSGKQLEYSSLLAWPCEQLHKWTRSLSC